MNWSRRFRPPIELESLTIVTLRDAADYIQELPEIAQGLKQWREATLALMEAAAGKKSVVEAKKKFLFAHGRTEGLKTKKAKKYKIIK